MLYAEYANGDILFTFGDPPKQSSPEDLEESFEETEETADVHDDIKVEDEGVQDVRPDEDEGLQGAVTDINVEKRNRRAFCFNFSDLRNTVHRYVIIYTRTRMIV